MKSLFTKRKKWRFTIVLGGLVALVQLLLIHGLITSIALYPAQATLEQIHSWQLFTYINSPDFWQAQAFFLSAPQAASQFWWHPFWFAAVASFIVILWLFVALRRLQPALVIWGLLLLSLVVLVGFSSLVQLANQLPWLANEAMSLSSGTTQAIAFYLAGGALLISLGRWRS